jgi:endonuclease/exonuclease/phosphatase family metal-dependent hydrolase
VLTIDGLVTTRAAINVWRDASGAYPSDHAPVQALITLP